MLTNVILKKHSLSRVNNLSEPNFPKDPFLQARQLLAGVGVSVKAIENTPKGLSPDELRLFRIQREGELFLDALLLSLNQTLYDKSAKRVAGALSALTKWKAGGFFRHRLFFSYRLYLMRNFVIDLEEALYFWTEELQLFLVWNAALFLITGAYPTRPTDNFDIQKKSFDLCLTHIQTVTEQARAIKRDAEKALVLYRYLLKISDMNGVWKAMAEDNFAG